MDTLCGVGLPELVILALIGFVVIGPERSREVALTVGRWLRRVMTSTWWREFGQTAHALRDLPNTLVRMAELEEAQSDMQRTLSDINRAARIGMTGFTEDPPLSPVERGTISNPWGISNAVAQTTVTPRPASSEQEPEGPPLSTKDDNIHEQ